MSPRPPAAPNPGHRRATRLSVSTLTLKTTLETQVKRISGPNSSATVVGCLVYCFSFCIKLAQS